jgi:hypothetical protein
VHINNSHLDDDTSNGAAGSQQHASERAAQKSVASFVMQQLSAASAAEALPLSMNRVVGCVYAHLVSDTVGVAARKRRDLAGKLL